MEALKNTLKRIECGWFDIIDEKLEFAMRKIFADMAHPDVCSEIPDLEVPIAV